MVTLTDEMIRLYGLTGAMAGEEASPEDMAIMSMGSVAPVTPTAPTDNLLMPKIRPETATAGQTIATPSPVTPTTTAPDDPYSSLNDFQRRMLRFAAIKDAGMALQGKEGNTVATILGDITKQKDMARKAAAASAAQKQQATFMSMMGIGGAGATGLSDLNAKRNAIISGGISGIIEPQMMDAMLKELDRQEEIVKSKETEIKVTEGKINQTKDILGTAKTALLAATGLESEEFDQLALLDDAEIESRKFRLSRFLAPEGMEGEDFKNYKAAAAKVASIMTLQNLSDVIASGAKLGILSDSDIRLLGDMTGVIDVDNMPQQTADNIFRLYRKLNKTLQVLESGKSSTYLDEKLKQYGLVK